MQKEDVVQIIVVSNRLSTAKTLTLTRRHVLGAGLALAALVVSLSGLFSYLALRHAADLRLPFLQEAIAAVREVETQRTQEFVRDNLKAIATKVGQLQAQMLHMDSLGERLSSVTGIRPIDETKPAAEGKGKGGKGGPLMSSAFYSLNTEEISQEVEQLMKRAEAQTDYLSAVESSLMEQRVVRNRQPTSLPVDALWSASAYGWRADPFTGQRAMHEGVDFSAEVGTPIMAAANGVVVAAEPHPDYGLMVDVDHGNDYLTRYAHASRLNVKIGQYVKRGQKIAEVGNTGRSTGPHLHFEVRYKGASVNPAKFLPRKGDTALANAAKH
jgi:murein DD-endopeptidase MepM/ murein hydrolase activator NlpD